MGKTTVGATIGLAAARAGERVLLVELEGRSNLAAPFGVDRLGYKITPLTEAETGSGHLSALRVTPDQALGDYLSENGFRLGSRLARLSAIELVTTTAPGIRDLLTLGKIKSLEQEGAFDLIVVDAPAAGHAVTFLRAPAGMAESAPSGPIRNQADQALEMLTDAARCRVVLVTIPEETPVNEVIETAESITTDVGVHLAPVIVNAVWPTIRGLPRAAAEVGKRESSVRANRRDAAAYRLARQDAQRSEIDRLDAALDLPLLELPFLFTSEVGRSEIDTLENVLIDALDRIA